MYCRRATALLRLTRGVSQAPRCGFAAAAARYTGDQSDSFRPGGEVSSLWLSQPGTANASVIKCEKNLINDAKLRVESDRLFVYNGTSKQNMYTYFYLRDLCKCPQCVDPHSKQRSFRSSDIPSNVAPRRVEWDNKKLVIQWQNDIPGYGKSHTSSFDPDYLERPVTLALHDPKNLRQVRPWHNSRMQRWQHWVSFEDYMNDEVKFTAAMRNLQTLGLIFVKDIPESREMVGKIATRMGPLRNTFYGSTWDVRTVPQAKNVAYTNQHLGFHMDLMYMNEPPGFQLLHCLENSCEGGESLFSDTFNVVNWLRMHSTKSDYDLLTQMELAYEYQHEDQIYHHKRPVIQMDATGEFVQYVNYSPPFQSALPLAKTSKDDQDRLMKILRIFAKQLQKPTNIFQLKLNPGECAIFNNRRIAHARNHFNTTDGSRWLAGAYVDEDAILSRYAVCQKKYPNVWRDATPATADSAPNDATED
ncbi:uncharacterized protein PFLUO_LOCUS1384 [Penicillium psychrofluorescens]|uniref:uncharacterized protein n=1 Tax=Penicillium psychrofluorescens TaxID=3158075 RepID=UPI003CCE1928